MHLHDVPPGSKVRYQVNDQYSLYGYVDIVNGVKSFITQAHIYHADVTNLFLKPSDNYVPPEMLSADGFHHLEPYLPFKPLV